MGVALHNNTLLVANKDPSRICRSLLNRSFLLFTPLDKCNKQAPKAPDMFCFLEMSNCLAYNARFSKFSYQFVFKRRNFYWFTCLKTTFKINTKKRKRGNSYFFIKKLPNIYLASPIGRQRHACKKGLETSRPVSLYQSLSKPNWV